MDGCRQVYDAAQTRYKGRATAPLLIDKKQQKLVSNESSDIMRMLNSVSLPGSNNIDLYPQHLQPEINDINDLVYDKVHTRSVLNMNHRICALCFTSPAKLFTVAVVLSDLMACHRQDTVSTVLLIRTLSW